MLRAKYVRFITFIAIALLGVSIANAQSSSPSRAVAVGLVESMVDGILTIEGIPFDLSDAQVQTEAALQAGARVRVRFAVDRSGVLRADRVQLASSDENAQLILAGTVTALESDSLQLARISLNTSRAEFESLVDLGDLVVLMFEDDVEGGWLYVSRVGLIDRLADVGRADQASSAENPLTPTPELPFTIVNLDDARFDDVFDDDGFNDEGDDADDDFGGDNDDGGNDGDDDDDEGDDD